MGLDVYRTLSDEWTEPEKQKVLGTGKIESVRAEGGPYDGVDLTVPPGATQVLLPARFADEKMFGKVLYERCGGVMAYRGQPDQTDPAHTDDDPTPKLIL